MPTNQIAEKKMDKFLETHKFPKLMQEEIETP
jgi:hypothetical protein